MCCCLKLPLINISSCLTTGIVANTRFDVSRTQQVAPRCLDAKSFYCDKIDFGRNAAFFFFSSPLGYACSHDDSTRRQMFASAGSDFTRRVFMCVCQGDTQDKWPASAAKLLLSFGPLRRKNCLYFFLIDLTVKYLVLNENCSHTAQVLSEDSWFALWIRSHTCNSISPQ